MERYCCLFDAVEGAVALGVGAVAAQGVDAQVDVDARLARQGVALVEQGGHVGGQREQPERSGRDQHLGYARMARQGG